MVAEVIVDIAHSEVDRVFDYLCGDEVCAGMRVTVPFARSVTTGIVMRVKEESELPPEKLKKIIRVLDELPALNAECLALAEKLARRYRCPKALVLRLFLPAEMRTGKVSERVKSVVSLEGDIGLIPPRAKRQRELAEFLSSRGEADLTALREEFGSAVKGLEERGMLHIEKRRVFRDPYERLQKSAPLRPLTPAQEAAVHTIERTQKTVTLIHGVTGSGKTEIYLTLIAHALEAGKSAVFLVPEISLTPQMFAQLRARFQMSCAILHSGLSAGERFDEWERLRSGEARIAIGARSAVFAPLEHIGVIVIDEEHDGSYSSESSPRYNTFDIAYLRAKHNGCKLVLGSATPSVETYRRAKQGEFELITLPERINRRPMPEVHLVDMRREVKRGNPSPFSAALRERLETCLEKGDQAILFLNRRGYSQTVIGRSGHFVPEPQGIFADSHLPRLRVCRKMRTLRRFFDLSQRGKLPQMPLLRHEVPYALRLPSVRGRAYQLCRHGHPARGAGARKAIS